MGTATLVGRQAEVALLADLARRACAGRGAVALIEGEPGIGKTALLDVLAQDCAWLGMRVARGDAEELEQGLPFAAIGACLGLRGPGADDGGPRAARVAALLRGDGAFGQSTAAMNHELAVNEAILDLVDGWCADGPVALIVDDAQWADPASVVVLNQLARGAAEQPLLLVIALRAGPRRDDVDAFARRVADYGAAVLSLGPLDEQGVDELLRHALAEPAGSDLQALIAGAGGNPLYILELLAAHPRQPDIAPEAVEVPRSLAEIVMRRLELVPRKTAETLRLAAALGPTIDAAELSATLDMPVADVFETIGVATEAGLLVEADGQVVFRHDVIREVAAGQVPASVRTALHLRGSEVLRATGAPLERIAEHLAEAAALDRGAIDWLDLHADELMARAPGLAVALLRRALAEADGETVARLRFQLIRGLLWAGDAAEAEQAARAALADGPPDDQEGPLRWLLTQACFRLGRLPETLAVVQEALSSPRLAPSELGRFHGFLGLCRTIMLQVPETAKAASEAIRIGETADDQVAVGYGLCLLSGVDLVQCRYEDGLSRADRAIEAFGGGVQPDMQMDPYYLRGVHLFRLDRYAAADRALADSERQNLERGGVYAALSGLVRIRIRVLDGRWDDALAQIRTGSETFDPYNFGLPMRWLATLIRIHRGTFSDADEVPDDEGGPGAEASRFLAVWVRALAEEVRTGARPALDLLYPIWTDGRPMEDEDSIYEICPDLARLAADAGDREAARQLADSSGALAARLPNATTRGIASLCAGLAGDDADLLDAAAQAFREAGRPLYEGYAREYRAGLLGLAGDAAAARTALREARTPYTALDAAWDAARADARLRRLGIRRGVTGPRKRPKRGWNALTETETKVALLVADGRSNPDIAGQMFLSRRTIQTHVSSILAKLGLKSRVEIAIDAYRQPTA